MLAGSSCVNGLIFEGEGDCGVYYRIRFKYDYNIKFADAFANEVNSVALYVF
ncbi:MAG: FimB/Mfa2 family fimbrial subunit, partial [Bacteroidales bacterium]|nr:FimB/Mfa2 family fimbrial subunit [Bacteroidales bacterium]